MSQDPYPDRPVTRVPGEAFLREVKETYESGRALDACRLAESWAPLTQWSGVWPCVLAARIAANVGGSRLATRLTVRAWKAAPRDPEARAQYGYELLGRRGPLALWEAMRGDDDAMADPGPMAEILALLGRAAADLRDFARAEHLLARAEAADPGRPWIKLQQAHLLKVQDRIEESLETARAACALHRHPFYRAGVQTCAHLLELLDRDEEALALLGEAGAVLQNGPVAAQHFGLLCERRRWAEAEAALDRFVALSPLIEPAARRWVDSQRARLAYHLGRREVAASLAQGLDDEFHRHFAERLRAEPPPVERVQLEVTFVRQHFKTCAPATLAAIGRYWRMPDGHLQMAEAMCYDGTPHWQQRDWAGQHGWCVREFRVTAGAALALLERGLPFAISVVEATSAHMMAVIGFDRTRGTLLLRDPGQPHVTEVHAEAFLERYRAFGPRGAVFVPTPEQARLEGLDLPEAPLYDANHRFHLALSRHNRAAAVAALETLERDAPGAMLTWETRLELAAYDANPAEQLRCLDELIRLFPDEPARLLRKLGCLQDRSRADRLEFLRGAGAARDADPALMIALGRTLVGDGRLRAEARLWLRRALRRRPFDATAVAGLADLFWDDGRLEQATEYYRFAANLEGFREHLYQSWFVACRRTRRTDDALAHLQDRFERFGIRSGQPALTLAWAWREMEQPARARQVLEDGIARRPDDGELLLRAAAAYAALGGHAEAARLHQSARGRVRENDWLRNQAELAELRLDFDAVLEASRALLAREPLALDAHAAVARVLSHRQGTRAALDELARVCTAFPHHHGLHRMQVEWSREAGAAAHEASCRELLGIEPGDAWARRELAIALLRQQRGQEALAEATEAARIEPGHSFCASILGHVHRHLGDVQQARTHFRRAVALSVDHEEAIRALLELARSDAERREDLAFVEAELIRQVVKGDGLLAYLEIARPLLEPQALLDILRRAHAERPDLWHAWSALVSHLTHLGRIEEALALATEATARFPHLPRLWLDLAAVEERRGRADEEIAAATRAFDINPAWSRAAHALAEALERRHRLEEARQVHERALVHSPREPFLHAALATLHWRQGRPDAAFAALEEALRLAPGFDWAWSLLSDWSAQSGETGRTAEFVRRLARERPGEMRVWLRAARILAVSGAETESLAAVERALALEPRSTEAWDARAELLAKAERFAEALDACRRGLEVCTADTHVLRGREAWVEARRRRLPEAVALMRAVLADNRSYVWGWHQLARWEAELGALDEAAAALEQLQQLCPRDAWVHRQLGILRRQQEDTAGARAAFAAALASDPTDVAAAHNLIELQLRDSDLHGAEATLATMRLHQPGTATLAVDLKLQLQRAPDYFPHQTLEALCASPDPDPWPVDIAMEALIEADMAVDALRAIRRRIKAGPCHPQLGAAVVTTLVRQESLTSAAWFFFRLPPGELRRRAAAPLVQALARGRRDLLLRWLLWRRPAALREDDETWGQVGFALSHFERMAAVVRWMEDWRGRPRAQPWMLFNLCLALRHLGRYDEANAVARQVVGAWEHREGAADLHLFLAVETALAGDLAAAREHLKLVVVREQVRHDQQLLTLARTLTELQETLPEERRARAAALDRELAPQFGGWQLLQAGPDIRRTFDRARVVFRRAGAGLLVRGRLWWWRHGVVFLLVFGMLVAVAVGFARLEALPLGLFLLLLWHRYGRR